MRRVLAVLLMALALAPPLAAQGDAGALITRARQAFEAMEFDSSAALLERALAQGSGATPGQRVRAFVLYGIAQLLRGNGQSARQAFRGALRLSPSERVDSLEFLEPDSLVRIFNVERQAFAVSPAAAQQAPVQQRLTVAIDAPDTLLRVSGEVLPIILRPSRTARIDVSIGPADAPLVISWSDTLQAGASGALGWNLRTQQGEIVTSGRYAVRATAHETGTGATSDPYQMILVISRPPVDTQALPAEPVPETEFLDLRRGSPLGLLAGVGVGAAVALVRSSLGRSELNSGFAKDGTAYAVAGTVSLASLVGFLAGRRERFLPEVAARNETRLRQHQEAVQTIAAANARALAEAPVRVQRERSTP